MANADQLLFWGKVTTTSSPYYIALAIDFKGHYGFPHKKFFYRYQSFHIAEITSSSNSFLPSTNSTRQALTSSTVSLSREILKLF